MEFNKIDGKRFYYMLVNASNRLEEQKEYVNSLNVFPVPDGDTGTNMSMTFRAAITEISSMESDSIGEISKRLSKGALMGARGNSGVILSQILRGLAKSLDNKDEIDSAGFANGLLEGSKSAYKAVMRPTEGTILTIIRAAGEYAVKSQNTDITELLKEVCEHSEAVLKKTPEMLPALKKANVVDSGGMGLLIILKGMYEALSENLRPEIIEESKDNTEKTSPLKDLGEQEIKFGYCTEFIIHADNADLEKFKSEIEAYGDSMVVVGLEDIVKVHIHSNDPGLIISKALKLGELSKIKIDNMREEHRNTLMDTEETKVNELAQDESSREELKKYAFISVAMGEGIRNILKDMGVDFVVEGGQTMNPSTQDILQCIDKLNAENIIILPNNKNIIMAAKQAAEISDKKIQVVPTESIPQGIAALTVFNPEKEINENMEAMADSLKKVKTGAITYAIRDSEMDGKLIKEGDILGLVNGKIAEVGTDVYKVCKDIISDMVSDDSELITLFYGKDSEASRVEDLVSELEDEYGDIDIQSYEGQQPLYYFIISVE